MTINIANLRFVFLIFTVLLAGFDGTRVIVSPLGVSYITILAAIYVVVSILHVISLNRIKKDGFLLSLIPLSVFSYIFLISLIYYLSRGGEVFYGYFFEIFIGVFLFYFSLKDIQSKPKLLTYIYLAFIIGMLFVAILVFIGMGLETGTTGRQHIEGVSRLWFFGSNPNILGQNIALAIMLSVFLIFDSFRSNKTFSMLLLASLPFLLHVLFLTASKGAVFVLASGVAVYFLFRIKNIISWFLFMCFWVGFFVAIYNIYVVDSLFYERLTQTTELTSGRLDIWLVALQIFYENPLFGASDPGYRQAMLNLYGGAMDTHNLLLLVLVKGGVISFLLFVVFIFKLFVISLNYFWRTKRSSALALFVACFIISFKSGGVVVSPYLWLFFACIASYKCLPLTKQAALIHS